MTPPTPTECDPGLFGSAASRPRDIAVRILGRCLGGICRGGLKPRIHSNEHQSGPMFLRVWHKELHQKAGEKSRGGEFGVKVSCTTNEAMISPLRRNSIALSGRRLMAILEVQSN
jgi:hypothetical protein